MKGQKKFTYNKISVPTKQVQYQGFNQLQFTYITSSKSIIFENKQNIGEKIHGPILATSLTWFSKELIEMVDQCI